MFLKLIASLLGQMFGLRTSDFRGATIRPIVPRQKHSIVQIDSEWCSQSENGIRNRPLVDLY